MELNAILRELTAAPGASGDEQQIRETAKRLLAPYGEVHFDKLGNVVCEVKGSGKYHVLLDAHMDQIGLAVLEITPEGFLRAAPCGGADKRVLAGEEVVVYGKEPLFGVITSAPPHLLSDADKGKVPESLLVDIGLSEEKAKALVTPGDRILLRYHFRELLGSAVSAPALDDRAGLAVLLYALEFLKNANSTTDLTVVFSTREETTEGGAKAAAFAAGAEECIAVDVSFAYTPDAKREDCGVLGKGPMIGFAPALTREISEQLEEVAMENQIPSQREIMSGSTGTNVDVMTPQAGGMRSGLLSIPLRYMHTGIEVVDTTDVENTGLLLAKYILHKEEAAC